MRRVVQVFLSLALLLSFNAGVMAQDSDNVDLITRWAYGPVSATTTFTDGAEYYQCVGYGGYLEVYDLTDNAGVSDAPALVGQLLLPKPVISMIAFTSGTDEYIIAVDGWGARVIDVTDPANPALLASVETLGHAYDVAVDETNGYAFIADGAEGLRAIDLTDNATIGSPSLQAYDYNGGGITRAVVYDGTNIFVTCTDGSNPGFNMVRMFTHDDAATPALVQVNSYTGVNYPLDIAFGDFTDAGPAARTGLFVADSSRFVVLNRADLSVLGTIAIAAPGIIDNLAFNVDDEYVYAGVRGATNNLQYWDIAAENFAAAPITVGAAAATEPSGGIIQDLSYYDDSPTTSGPALYVANGYGGAKFYDATDITAGTGWDELFDQDPTGAKDGYLHDVVVDAALNIAYVADGDDGVRRIAYTTGPDALTQSHSNMAAFAACTAYGVALGGNDVLYVACGDEGVKTFDDDDLVAGADVFDTDGRAYAVAYYENYVYVADGNNGLRIISTGDWTQEAGAYNFTDVSYKAVDVKIWEDDINNKLYAFLAVEFEGLWIVEVTNPAAPTLTTSLTMAGGVYAVDIDVMGHYVYVADGVDGLRVVDVRTITTPVIIGTENTGGSAIDVMVNGSFAYVADGTGGLRIISISTPAAPAEVGYYDTGDVANAVYVADDTEIYITDRNGGLYLFDNLVSHLNHFNDGYADYIDPSGRSIPVVIADAVILSGGSSDLMTVGDEIGVFDNQNGTLQLVGSGKYQGSFPFVINVWMQFTENETGTTVPGAVPDQPMIFKIWDNEQDEEYGGFAVYTRGSGNFDETELMTLVDPLNAVDLSQFAPVMPTGQYITVHIDNDITYNGVTIDNGDEIVVVDADQNNLVVGGAVYRGAALDIPVWIERNSLTGASTNNTMAFRAYLNAYGQTFVARAFDDSDNAIIEDFNGNASIAKLRMYETDQVQRIAIEEDRINLISFYINPKVSGGSTLVSEMLSTMNYDAVALAQDDLGNAYIAGSSIDNLGNVSFAKSYQVYYDNDPSQAADTQHVTIHGYAVNATDYTIALSGLQMIGYPYENAYWAQDVFASIYAVQSLMVIEDDAGTFWIKDDANGLDLNYFDNYGGTGLVSGKGYKIYTHTAINYTYPAASTLPRAAKAIPVDQGYAVIDPVHFTFKETGDAYPVVITGSDYALVDGDEIGLYDGDICVGAAVYQGSYPFIIAAWKKVEASNLSLPGFSDGNSIGLRLYSATVGQEYDADKKSEAVFGAGLYASFEIDGVATAVEDAAVPTEFGLDANYPNPFNPETMIQFRTATSSEVKLVIYNSKGQRVRTLVDEMKNAGVFRIKWDGCDERGNKVSSGLYIVKMKAGEYLGSHKMMMIQ
ncbi:T9SS type A sorting domain-containing protein [bacterium]|nr:T9SS type A sorting domain-containing protein [bacterium]